MPALPRPSALGDWGAIVASVIEPEMHAKVSFYDPDTDHSQPYNPVTDTGGNDEPVRLFTTTAMLHPQRSPLDASSDNGWDVTRNVLAQIPLKAAPGVFIRKGLVVRIHSGVTDDMLLRMAFTVETAANASDAGVRLVNLVTDGSEVPPVPDPEP